MMSTAFCYYVAIVCLLDLADDYVSSFNVEYLIGITML